MKMSKAGGDERVTLVTSYGDNGFRVSGERVDGSLLIVNNRVERWPVAAKEEITAESLAPVRNADPAVEILIVGTGSALGLLPAAARKVLDAEGVIFDVMDTGAAARTYNVLALEGRRVAAALIAIE